MHDLDSLIADIKIPIPFTRTKGLYPQRKHIDICQIWHRDPCVGGSDDSCGRFMRAHHGDKSVMDKAIERLSWDWDRTFTLSEEDHDEDDGPYERNTRFVGMFQPNGYPMMSTPGIVFNIYFAVLFEMHVSRGPNLARKKACKYINKNVAEIVLFSENPTDSLHSTIRNIFGDPPTVKLTKSQRDDRIRGLVSAVYGDVLRKTRPWWRSPSLHIHHWRIQIPFFRNVRRFFTQCPKCGLGLGWNKSIEADWHGNLVGCHRCCGAALKCDTPVKSA